MARSVVPDRHPARIAFIFALLLCCGSAMPDVPGGVTTTTTLRDASTYYSVLLHSTMLVDRSDDLDIDDVTRSNAFGSVPPVDHDDDGFETRWYRFALLAAADRSQWILRTDAVCSSAELYRPQAGGNGYHRRSFGWEVPFAKHPTAAFESASIALEPNDLTGKTLYVRLRCRRSGAQLAVVSDANFLAATLRNPVSILDESFVLMGLGIVAVIFFVITKERLYLLSALSPLAYGTFSAMLTGAFCSLFSDLPCPPFAYVFIVGRVLFYVAEWLFVRAFLDLPQQQPVLSRFFTGALVVASASIIVGELGPRNGDLYESLFAGLFYTFPIVAGTIAVRKGSKTARYFLAGTFAVALALIAQALGDYGIVIPVLSYVVFYGGVPFESLMFFTSTAERLRQTLDEREQALAQSDAARAELIAMQEAQIRDIERRNLSFARFVPLEFLEQLSREDIVDVALGDHLEREMTVLFTDIRGFTTLSEAMTPQQTLTFLNAYLAQAGPVIRKHGGFVDKYIGDAIMALFPRTPADAVEAALSLQRNLRRFNDDRARAGADPIAIGIGINHGNLVLATIGETERYETTVLADAVNVASRLEGLTKRFGAGIVVGEAVIRALPENHGYHLRPLGAVILKGTTYPLNAYEIFDGDPPELLLHKRRTLESFESGIAAYRAGDFAVARETFERIATANVNDRGAAQLRDRNAELATAAGLIWDGVDRLEFK